MEQVTIRDIAKICGVGISTVSRAINNHPDINQETKKLIIDTARAYNYVPNNSARNLKRVESNAIALLAKGVGNPLFAEMTQTVQDDVLSKDYLFILQQVDEGENELETGIRLAKEKRLKGIIFMGGSIEPREDLLSRLPVPYVICTVNAKIPMSLDGYGIVSIDDEAESFRMVDYLCEMGHTSIAILTADECDNSIGKLRLNGYRKALETHKISFDESLVIHMPSCGPIYTMRNGYKQTMELLDSGKKFTAIYAISDTIAIGACKAIFDHGLRVPDDISVAGFDGLDMAHYYQPSITTIRQPLQEMAFETSRMLFDLIREKKEKKRHIFEATLVKGQSVAQVRDNGS